MVILALHVPFHVLSISCSIQESHLPSPPAYIFMIDVSISMFQRGVVQLLTQTMLSILENLPKSSNSQSPVKVGFVTYDRVLHFYNVKVFLSLHVNDLIVSRRVYHNHRC